MKKSRRKEEVKGAQPEGQHDVWFEEGRQCVYVSELWVKEERRINVS